LGAEMIESEDYFFYNINLKRFEDLEKLLQKVNSFKKENYAAIISFDPPTIYLDKDV
jgi:hypothetical protein